MFAFPNCNDRQAGGKSSFLLRIFSSKRNSTFCFLGYVLRIGAMIVCVCLPGIM